MKGPQRSGYPAPEVWELVVSLNFVVKFKPDEMRNFEVSWEG